MDESLMQLFKMIAEEGAELSIRYEEQNDDLIFSFSVQGETFKDVVTHSDAISAKDNKVLLTYVLEEILSVVRGIKEGI